MFVSEDQLCEQSLSSTSNQVANYNGTGEISERKVALSALFDTSGSMGDKVDGRTKFDIARAHLDDCLKDLRYFCVI